MSRDYISCADSAKMLRAALKRNFPGVKFSVRSKSYAGGASIYVSWNNGPSAAMVDPVAQRFHGADFDAMTDCKSPVSQILVGEGGAMREVQFGSHYIMCQRHTADGLAEACMAEYRRTFCRVLTHNDEVSAERGIWRALAELSIPPAETVEETARRVVAHIFSPVQS